MRSKRCAVQNQGITLIMGSPVFPSQKNLGPKWKQAYSIFDLSLSPSWFVFVKWYLSFVTISA